MGWVVALPALATLWALNKKFRGKGGKGRGKAKTIIALVTMGTAAVAGCGIAYTFAGRWLAGLVGWVSGTAAGVAGEAGIAMAIPIAITVGLVLVAAADLAYDRVADKGAQIAVAVLPTMLFLVVGGALGETGGEAVRTVTTQMSTVIGQLGGS